MKQIDLEPHEWRPSGRGQGFWGPNWFALPLMLAIIGVATAVKVWTEEPKDPNVLLDRDGVRIKRLPDAAPGTAPSIKQVSD